jgi:hypothetical protein
MKPTSGEVISFGFGAAGVNIMDTICKQVSFEHDVSQPSPIGNWHKYFSKTNDSQNIVPRVIMADLEPDQIDPLRHGQSIPYRPSNLISGKESSASNYCRGHYTLGRHISEKIIEAARKEFEKCDHVDSLHLHFSQCGGTAGLASLIAERLSVYYPKPEKIFFTELPSPNTGNSPLDPYNAILGIHDCLYYSDLMVYYQNEKLYDIFNNNFGCYTSGSYNSVNYLLSLAYSDITSPIRFGTATTSKTLPHKTQKARS